ncbi:Hypothetical_protein [Hexamita inflata]|uniref:Hypothetical_protein n=1 Tax=Hexamita inflata TaxID=28002 RepID=A0AA86UXV4_9EUKA|nr:Hypothetical protein HINF_LOCUS56582 [Hexamita inflata]
MLLISGKQCYFRQIQSDFSLEKILILILTHIITISKMKTKHFQRVQGQPLKCNTVEWSFIAFKLYQLYCVFSHILTISKMISHCDVFSGQPLKCNECSELCAKKEKCAPPGNRTRISCVASKHSTTRPAAHIDFRQNADGDVAQQNICILRSCRLLCCD